MECSAQEPNILLVVAYRKDGHTAGSETHLLMRHTRNKGLTNSEYKSTQQDLTDEKSERLRNAGSAQGNQGEVVARIKVLLHKSY
jgi:hypothetical protein